MPKPKKNYPKGCSDLGRLFNHLGKEEKAKRRGEYLKGNKPIPSPKGEDI